MGYTVEVPVTKEVTITEQVDIEAGVCIETVCAECGSDLAVKGHEYDSAGDAVLKVER